MIRTDGRTDRQTCVQTDVGQKANGFWAEKETRQFVRFRNWNSSKVKWMKKGKKFIYDNFVLSFSSLGKILFILRWWECILLIEEAYLATGRSFVQRCTFPGKDISEKIALFIYTALRCTLLDHVGNIVLTLRTMRGTKQKKEEILIFCAFN